MKITYSKSGTGPGGSVLSFKLGSSLLSLEDVADALKVEVGATTLYLEGDVHYVAQGDKAVYADAATVKGLVQKAFADHGPAGFAHAVEGSYVAFWVDTGAAKAGVFPDEQNRRWLYCTETGDGFFGSTRLKDAVDRAKGGGKLNQFGLYSYLTLGYTPVSETFYPGVTRPGTDERIEFSASGVSRKVEKREQSIQPYEKSMIDRYDTLITDAVHSRMSPGQNVVMNSGGWDSTSLICLLLKGREAKSVSSVVFDVLLSDGQSFNSYEVDKANRIAKFYGIGVDRATIDYSDKSLVPFWESHAENQRSNHIYFWLHHLKMAAQIGTKAGKGAAAFNGECSDSIHNFGFSQFVSVNYDNLYLREYADKMKSYLSGPTFFNRIADGSYEADKVFQFFRYYYGADRFESAKGWDKKRLRESYFMSFMWSYQRIPFAKWRTSPWATDALYQGFAQHLADKYHADAVANVTHNTLYYYLLQQYRQFHFQGWPIHTNPVALAPMGVACRIPFMDSRLIKYMYSMPEDWGRGLELRTTKYPLRYLANERWRMPIHILEESGPHSYIAESDTRWTYAGGKWSIYCEIMYKSVFKSYFQSIFKKTPLDSYFDPKYFDLKSLQTVIDGFHAGSEDPETANLLYKLAMLFSIGVLR